MVQNQKQNNFTDNKGINERKVIILNNLMNTFGFLEQSEPATNPHKSFPSVCFCNQWCTVML